MFTSNDESLESAHQRVVEAVHGLDHPYCMVQMSRDKNDIKTVPRCLHFFGTYPEHMTRLDRKPADQAEWYMVVAQTWDESTKVDNITQSWAVAVDFDHGLPDECQRGKSLEQTQLIETSPGRFHAIWVVDKPMEPHDMNRLAKVMAARLNGDMAMARVNQMVRLPGRTNHKHGGEVILREGNSNDKPFTYEFLWMACDGDLYEAHVKLDLPHLNHINKSALRDSPEMVVKHAQEAVEHLATVGFADSYDTWFKTIANLAPLGSKGYEIALAFSKRSVKFDPEAFDRKWKSCVESDKGMLSTLYAIAQQEGWKNPGWSGSESNESVRIPTDRDFGSAVAHELAGKVAAIDSPQGTRQKNATIFYLWNGSGHVLLNPRQKRTVIAEAAESVIKRKRQGGNEQAWHGLEKKLGSNKSLEEVSEHVAEALVPMSEPRVVGRYPYLPVANGILNLLTGQLVPHRYQPIPTQVCRVAFDPKASADRFNKFLSEVLKGDEPMIAYVRRVLGYAVLGKPKEQMMFVLIGPSSNGKSTLLEVVMAILGPYATRLRTETLMQKSHVNDGASPALANLTGKRLAVVAEPNANHRLDTSLVKQLTGESSMQVRGLFSDGLDMTIECCLFMTANFMPFANAEDKGLWRRMRIIPFDRIFTTDEIDPNLKDELIAEGSGVLNVLLEGIADYFKQGLNPPTKVSEAVDTHRQEADAFTMFLKDCCEFQPLEWTELKTLWSSYQGWAKANSKFRTMVKSELQARLVAKFESKKRGNLPIFIGIQLTTPSA